MRITKDMYTTATEARSILMKHTDRCGIFFDLDLLLEYKVHFTKLCRKLIKEFQDLTNESVLPTQRERCKQLAMQRFRIPPDLFYVKGRESFNKLVCERILESPHVTEDAKHYVRIYQELGTALRDLSSLDQYISCPLSVMEAYDGHRMVIARPNWNILSTSRISASEPSIQNLNRDWGDLVTYPKGYILVSADSGQIEPRIIYSAFVRDKRIAELITLYNDAYYGYIHYIFRPESNEKFEINDRLKDLRSQIKTMGNAASYGSNMQDKGFDPKLAEGFLAKIKNNPARQEFVRRVEQDVARGATTFYSYFGTEVTPDETQTYRRGTPGWEKHLVRCGVNNPIQTTAADLMNMSVKQADGIIKAMGDRAHILWYKHDEGKFLVPEDNQILIPMLVDCMSYIVDGWIPIYADEYIGRKKGILDD